jgi:hypothetical protein
MGTYELREKTLTEKHRSSRIAAVWLRVDNPEKLFVAKSEEKVVGRQF